MPNSTHALSEEPKNQITASAPDGVGDLKQQVHEKRKLTFVTFSLSKTIELVLTNYLIRFNAPLFLKLSNERHNLRSDI